MQINQNIPALNAYRSLANNQGGIGKAMECLSSGLRINRAADDAAGLAISETMRAQVNGLNQGSRNTGDAINLIQTAEGGLNETHAILQRMRVLAVQAANSGVMSDVSLGAIQAEMDQLTADIDRIAESIKFNGMTLLDGSFRDKNMQVGANAGDVKPVTITSGIIDAVPAMPAGIALWGTYQQSARDLIPNPFEIEHTLGGVAQSVSINLTTPLGSTADLIGQLTSNADFNALFTVKTGAHTFIDGTTEAAANVIIMAKEPGAGGVQVANLPEPALKVKRDPGRDETPEYVGGYGSADILGIVDVTTRAGSGPWPTPTNPGPTETFGSANDIPPPPWTPPPGLQTWPSGATIAIGQIDRAIEIVSKGRAEMGAIQNVFGHVVRSVDVSAENLALSESRIRDADFAKEVAELQRWQILAQSSMSMLAEANKVPQTVLSLIK